VHLSNHHIMSVPCRTVFVRLSLTVSNNIIFLAMINFICLLKDEYFEIVQALKTWLLDKLEGYDYSKQDLQNKIDDPNYQLTSREKEGLALTKEMLDRITENTLAAD
jgi:hypothetical protein